MDNYILDLKNRKKGIIHAKIGLEEIYDEPIHLLRWFMYPGIFHEAAQDGNKIQAVLREKDAKVLSVYANDQIVYPEFSIIRKMHQEGVVLKI